MTKIETYSLNGTKGTPVELPKSLGGKVNKNLLAQAIYVFENRLHSNKPVAKTRAEVDITKKKIYRQKGTGRARHGAASAPIFVGGGKAHGPTGEKRKLSLSKNMRLTALSSAINLKLSDKKLAVIDGVSKIEKTKIASKLMNKICKEGVKITVFLANSNKEKAKMFRNISNVRVYPYDTMNAHKVFLGGFIIFDKDALVTKKDPIKKSTSKKTASTLKPKKTVKK
ncbi:50S ribosomal protein L4 [Candidatus Woesebacteria bacterium]|nr:MAG: 50S ribosomal protein L4 [Candidatus Woesebacteria bacterium]